MAVVAAVPEASKTMGQGGRIVTIGSVNGEAAPFPEVAFYAASKGAVRMLTKGLARDLGERGITANIVQPNPVETDPNPSQGSFADMLTGLMALMRHGRPEDVAGLVAFLASPASGKILAPSTWICYVPFANARGMPFVRKRSAGACKDVRW